VKKIWIISLFPEFFKPLTHCGVIAGAFKDKFDLNIIDLREYSFTKYKGVDDSPFGGGAGMVIKPDVLANSMKGIKELGGYTNFREELEVVFPSPRGISWNQKVAKNFAQNSLIDSEKDLVFICGRYEGIDERFLQNYVDSYYSVGDFILSGGEIATLTILDSALRFVPEVLGNMDSLNEESFEDNLLEYALYTRPREFEGLEIPEELISGSHAKIKSFKKKSKEEITKKYRPDLWQKHKNSMEEL